MPSRIITTDRAGQIWNRITWCCLLIFVLSGLVAMLVQTTLPANLGYPQLHSPGVPDSVTYTVIACEIAAFLVPALLATSCGRKASRLGRLLRRRIGILFRLRCARPGIRLIGGAGIAQLVPGRLVLTEQVGAVLVVPLVGIAIIAGLVILVHAQKPS